MGNFSWLDCDSVKENNRQIVNDKCEKVYLLIPKEFGGGYILESQYGGYGEFGGKDVYDLVIDWNIKDITNILQNKDNFKCEWVKEYEEEFIHLSKGEPLSDGVDKRTLGIAIACYDEDNAKLKYPIKVTHREDLIYEDANFSLSDPNQGWGVSSYYYESWNYPEYAKDRYEEISSKIGNRSNIKSKKR